VVWLILERSPILVLTGLNVADQDQLGTTVLRPPPYATLQVTLQSAIDQSAEVQTTELQHWHLLQHQRLLYCCDYQRTQCVSSLACDFSCDYAHLSSMQDWPLSVTEFAWTSASQRNPCSQCVLTNIGSVFTAPTVQSYYSGWP